MIDLSLLHDKFHPLVVQFQDQCNAPETGLIVRVTQGFRDPAYQLQLVIEGKSHATPKNDPHCFVLKDIPSALAIDFGCFNPDLSYISDGTDPAYAKAAAIAKSLGMSWGGDWIHNKDWDHLDFLWDWANHGPKQEAMKE